MQSRSITVTARVERTMNTGNYENIKIMTGGEVTLDLDEDEDYGEVYKEEQRRLYELTRTHLKEQQEAIRGKLQQGKQGDA